MNYKRLKMYFYLFLLALALTCLSIVFSLARPGIVHSQDPYQANMNYSAKQTDSAQISAVPAFFYGIVVNTDGTNNATVTIYDNTEASGTAKILDSVVFDTDGDNLENFVLLPFPIPCNTGIYADVSVSAGTVSYQVFYKAMK